MECIAFLAVVVIVIAILDWIGRRNKQSEKSMRPQEKQITCEAGNHTWYAWPEAYGLPVDSEAWMNYLTNAKYECPDCGLVSCWEHGQADKPLMPLSETFKYVNIVICKRCQSQMRRVANP
jgi:hypothetical protein